MIIRNLGLQVDLYTWPIFVAVAFLWWLTLRICPSLRQEGWVAVPKSFFGLAWIGFGGTYLLRFVTLSYDSVTFGNLSYRLANKPPSVVNEGLVLAGIYWIGVSAGYLFSRSRRGAGPFATLARFTPEMAGQPLNLVTLLTLGCVVASAGPSPIPLAIRTPLALVGSLWVIPATLIWWKHFQTIGSASGTRGLRFLLLLPGVFLALLSPYREHVVKVAAVPFIAALFAGKRFRLSRVLCAFIIFFLLSTVLISTYRSILWFDEPMEDAVSRERRAFLTENIYLTPWGQMLRRFHGYDSLLLATDLIPRVVPHSGRNILVDTIIQSIVPRALYREKELARRGMEFSRTIWADEMGRAAPEAAIAPSMAGDLYEAGGIPYILYGGLLYGLLLGLLDGWRRHLTSSQAATVVVLFGMQAILGPERDFVLAMATIIQTVLVLNLVMYFLPVKQQREPARVSTQVWQVLRLRRPFDKSRPPERAM